MTTIPQKVMKVGGDGIRGHIGPLGASLRTHIPLPDGDGDGAVLENRVTTSVRPASLSWVKDGPHAGDSRLSAVIKNDPDDDGDALRLHGPRVIIPPQTPE